jgi:hypothetical protein
MKSGGVLYLRYQHMSGHFFFKSLVRIIVLGFFAFAGAAGMAGTQVASGLSPSTAVSNVGGGEAYSSVVTPDGRFVAFCSTSDNLVAGPGEAPLQEAVPAHMNVFVRDRQAGTTLLVSGNATGIAGGNGDSFPDAISGNGQFVVFDSVATDLIAGNTNTTRNIYVRDVVSNITTLVSISTNGAPGNGDSREASATITPDGRYVAFSSLATNLVANDANGIEDVFVRDLTLGVTTLASPGAQKPAGNVTTPLTALSSSEFPILSADGRYVAFYSTALGFVQTATNPGELYVRDLVQGTTAWVSANAHQINPSGASANYAMSTNGQWIAYQSIGGTKGGLVLRYNVLTQTSDDISTNGLVAATLEQVSRNIDISADGRFVAFTKTNTGVGASIELWDGQSGTTSLISGGTAGPYCDFPRVDQTGRYVAFLSNDGSLTTNSDGREHIYMRDTTTGDIQLVDVGTNGVTPISSIMVPFYFSAGGGVIAFDCWDGAMSMNPYKNDAFARDLNANTTEIISTAAPGMPSVTPLNPSGLTGVSVSSNGQYAAFVCDCGGMGGINSNGFWDVYLHDLDSGSNTLVSVSADGLSSGNGLSYGPATSGDGRYVAFTSGATNLVANDTNGTTDVFLRDLQEGSTVLISQDVSGLGEGNSNSLAPQISADGQKALFFSYANNLTTNPSVRFSGENIFWRDLQAGTTYAITTGGTNPVAAMTPDGSNVVFSVSQQFCLWSAQSHSVTVLVTSLSSIPLEADVSADGSRAAFETSTNCYAVDLLARTNFVRGTFLPTAQTHSQFSADGRYLAYLASTAKTSNQVELYDFQSETNILVSQAYNSTSGGNSTSDSPAISSDGRYVAYRSAATNLVPGDTNGVPDVFLYDRLTGGTTLISVSELGPRSGNGRSLTPFFSGDGQTVFFTSWASDLAPGDYNESSDVFAVSLATNGLATEPLNFMGIFAGTTNGQFSANQPLTLTWSALFGAGYEIEFKNNLTDPQWQVLTNHATVVGNQGSVIDFAPNVAQRFYRVVSF